jgi:hypothetical protein
MQYATKLKAYPSNSAYDCVFNPLYKNAYDKQPNAIHPFAARSIALASELKIELANGNRRE